MDQNKSLAILFFEGYISVSPTIKNIIDIFNERGYKVNVITRNVQKTFGDYGFVNNITCLLYENELPKIIKYFFLKFSFLKKIYPKNYNQVYSYFLSKGFIKFCEKISLKNKYDIIIGVDTIGLVAAEGFIKFKNYKYFIYLSLEIDFLFNYPFILNHITKRKEIYLHRKVDLTIIQDSDRFNYLLLENNLKKSEIKNYFLPNSPRSVISSYCNLDINFIPSWINLYKDNFIVLSAGMIGDMVFSKEIAEVCKNDQSFKLIFHERVNRDINNDLYLKELQKINSDNLILSLIPIPFDNIDLIFNNIHIGVGIYNESYGANFKNILFASGKISHYLKFGKPIIVNNLPGMKSFISKWQCGIVINDISEFNSAVNEIKENYSKYSANAQFCYNSIFNFDLNCNKLIDDIEKSMSQV